MCSRLQSVSLPPAKVQQAFTSFPAACEVVPVPTPKPKFVAPGMYTLPRAFYGVCWRKSHTPSCFWAGGFDGVIQGGLAKSQNSVISICAASRGVRLGIRRRLSIHFHIPVEPGTVCRTTRLVGSGDPD